MSSLRWEDDKNNIPHIFIPKDVTGVQSNIIILLPSNFPTKSANDPIADFTLNKIKNTSKSRDVIFGGFDSSVLSYVYFANKLGLNIKVDTAKASLDYYLGELRSHTADISFSAPSISDFARIYDTNKRYDNFISMFGNFDGYTFNAKETFKTVKNLVKQYGNGKIKLLVSPTSSGALTGLAHKVKEEYPYSKTLFIESSKSPYFYSGKKGKHNLFGFSYGLIPLIHNIYTTDYVTVVDEDDIINLYSIFKNNFSDLVEIFGNAWSVMQSFKDQFSLATVASIIASINIAKQLYLGENDNVVIVAEDLASPFASFVKNLNKKKVESTIIKNMLEPEYKLTLDVTGQRHRERLFRKKIDYWLMRGVNIDILEEMREKEFWSKLV